MAFMLYSTDDGHMPAWNYLPINTSAKPQVGVGMVLDSNGRLVVSTQPDFICMRQAESYPKSGDTCPVIRIAPDQVWESILDADTSFTVGTKADLTASALYVDADASTNGTFLITWLEGNKMANAVRGRFV